MSIGESIRGRINYTFVPEQGRYVPTNGMLTPVLKYLSKKLNFSYEIVPSQRGGGTGIKLSNGSWNGMVADILMGDAEVALSVAQSFDREQVVGISPCITILIKKVSQTRSILLLYIFSGLGAFDPSSRTWEANLPNFRSILAPFPRDLGLKFHFLTNLHNLSIPLS